MAILSIAEFITAARIDDTYVAAVLAGLGLSQITISCMLGAFIESSVG